MASIFASAITICLMLVGLMAIVVYVYIKQDDQSHYYMTQVSIELILLTVAFSIVLFENSALRYFMVLLFLTAFFLNILTITYYVLFDEIATGCMKLAGFKSIVCLSSHLPAQHHTIYCAIFLALLHFLAFTVAMVEA
ncbi:hypothetical protein OESDEN_09690 [Oesophagostomum dentatum]|uniref:Uncharacterized protein n=1 Tax=Oesophagostomum dentatum TaxID=61180 RepID=A0A0B1SZP5_OESDE|nr:hypothetical protein OESDEN_09690 [Oesophagostomum dentatum]